MTSTHKENRPHPEIDFGKLSNVELIAHLLALKPDQQEIAQTILDEQPRGLGWLHASANTHAFRGMELEARHRHTLLAALELTTRIMYGHLIDGEPLQRPQDVARYISAFYSKTDQMVVGALFLESQNRLLEDRMFFQGNFRRSIAEPYPILARALRLSAKQIILFSTRTATYPKSCDGDIVFAKRVKRAAALIGIDLLDYVIVGNSGVYISLKQRGELEGSDDQFL
jgi:DNA repair protein RadC